MDNQRIKVVNPYDGWPGTKCYIGQKEVAVKSVDFHVAIGEAPTFTLETLGIPDIEMSGGVFFRFTPDTVRQAAVILRNEFQNNPESKNALVSSISSILKEMPAEIGLYDAAKLIANRIIDIGSK